LLAEAVGVESDNILIVENGDVVAFQNGEAAVTGKVTAGPTLVDGLGIGDVGNLVLRDRRSLAQDGIVIAVITLNREQGTILAGPDLVTRGFVYSRDSTGLLSEANDIAARTVRDLGEGWRNRNVLKQKLKDNLGRFLYEHTQRRPMILPILVEV
jgi:ribonuclease J